jgi:hypothetical protein
MQQIKNLSSIISVLEQLYNSKVVGLQGERAAAMSRVRELEAELAAARQAVLDKAAAVQQQLPQQQKGSMDDGDGGSDDQQPYDASAEQQHATSACKGTEHLPDSLDGCDDEEVSAALEGICGVEDQADDGWCEACEEAELQVANLTAQLLDARSNVAAVEEELTAARQQAGQACGSAVFARSQAKTLTEQLHGAAEKVVCLENEAAGWKQQAAQVNRELQTLREAVAAAAAAHAASLEAAKAETQQSRARSDRERAWLRQQLAQQRCNGLQLQAQLDAANAQVGYAVLRCWAGASAALSTWCVWQARDSAASNWPDVAYLWPRMEPCSTSYSHVELIILLLVL